MSTHPPGNTPTHPFRRASVPLLQPLRPELAELVDSARRARRPRGSIAIYAVEDLQAQIAQLDQIIDPNHRRRDRDVLHDLAERGPWRSARTEPKVLGALTALADELPHFAGVVRAVQTQLRLAQIAGRPARVTPRLLVGGPGLGKTHFAGRLAQALGVPVHRLAMDTVQTDSALAGGDSHWANTQTGIVFEALARGPAANPVIVLDEVDKACPHSGHGPLAPLHTLLEPETARCFADRSLSLRLDARHVVWIATANELESIDAPLLSRFAVHAIAPPDAAQALRVAQAVARALLAEFRLDLDIPEAVLVRLAALTPRAQRQALEVAAGEALARGAAALAESDLPAPDRPARRGMGFVWNT